jgi:tripartite-type tricarboxylate transporter receptor subunit TctC
MASRFELKPSTMIRKAVQSLFVAAVFLAGGEAMAQTDYPDRAIRLIVGFPAGGPPDIAARTLADGFTETWGRPVTVENVTGAGGNVANERVARSAPDGYTLAMTTSGSIVANPSLYERMSFDPVRDLAPISITVATPIALTANNDLPVRNVQDLVLLARGQPGRLTYGSAGVGTPAHLVAELFKSMAHVDIVHVPYRGMPQAMPDLLAGRISMAFPNLSVALPLIREGKIRALAVSSLTRPEVAPELPTLAESGFPGFNAPAWYGLMAPAETPVAIIDTLQRETARILRSPDIRKRLNELGMEVVANTPAEFSASIQAETAQWSKLIKERGLMAAD